MSTSDIIQTIIAVVAIAALLLTFWNIHITRKNIRTLDDQWAFKHAPVFKIIKVQAFNHGKNVFILDNHNDVFYQIQSVHFSDSRVKVESQRYGKIETALNTNGRRSKVNEFEGFQVVLTSRVEEKIRGFITLCGIDGLGNKFSHISELIILEKGEIKNSFDLTKTYFKKE